MILWSKDTLPSRHSIAAFHQVDFAPTIFEALGQPVPAGIDGRSRWSSIWDSGWNGPDELLFHLDMDGARVEALSAPPFKIVRQIDSSDIEFFNLERNSLEANTPLSDTSQMEVLESRLEEYRVRLGRNQYESEETELTQTVREQLEALGYLGEGTQ